MNGVPKDVIVLPEFMEDFPDRWVVMNVFARTCLGVDSQVLAFMSRVEYMSTTEIQSEYGDKRFNVWAIERFPYAVSSVADPTCYVRDLSAWGLPSSLAVDELIERLSKHYLLIENEEEYLAKFQLKKNVMDKAHFGNYHQQLGQHMLLNERKNPSKFWLEQKFTKDLSAVRSDNLYGAVQVDYLRQYFRKKISPGAAILDVGTGIGLYANMMAAAGGNVLGIDPSEEYINIARKNAARGTKFEVMNVGTEGALDAIPDNYADIVFMSDALLFYFVPVYPDRSDDIRTLFADIRRIMKNDGTFVSLEPHPIFWLSPWLGKINRPFTIITEYMNKNFGVTPTTHRLIQAFTQNGFVVTHMDELLPAPEFETVAPRAYYYAREFPEWYLFELKKY